MQEVEEWYTRQRGFLHATACIVTLKLLVGRGVHRVGVCMCNTVTIDFFCLILASCLSRRHARKGNIVVTSSVVENKSCKSRFVLKIKLSSTGY